MNTLTIKVYESASVLLPFALVYILGKKLPTEKQRSSKPHTALLLAFAIYIFGVFYFTGVSTIYDVQRIGVEIYNEKINLIPFSQGADKTMLVLNIILFVPLGFMLPLIWPGYRKIGCTLLAGLSFTLLIEISQLFNHRATDVDDLLMNTLGCLVGYVLFRVFAFTTRTDMSKTNAGRMEAALYIAVMFLGRFLLFNEYGFAKMLYGF